MKDLSDLKAVAKFTLEKRNAQGEVIEVLHFEEDIDSDTVRELVGDKYDS